MQYAIIAQDEFENYEQFKAKITELGVTEAIAGSSKVFEMLEKDQKEYPEVVISKAKGRSFPRAKNAMDNADNVLVFANDSGKIRSKMSIAYAKETNKNMIVCTWAN